MSESRRARPHLEGWKEIAGYFGRTVRTVQRWERDQALPIRRHQHADLASVYADPSELDAWRARQVPDAGRSGAVPVSLGSSVEDLAVLHAMAMDYWKLRTKDGFDKCIALSHAALGRNPACAWAYAMLALAHATRASYGHGPPRDDVRLGREYVKRALEIDPDSVQALQAKGFVHYFEFDWPQASETFEHAQALAPSDATTPQYYSCWFIAMDRDAEACEMAARAQRLGTWPQLTVHRSWMLHFAGRYEEAAALAHATIENNRHAWRGYFNLGLSLTALDRPADAVRAHEMACALNPHPTVEAAMSAALARSGDRAGALAVLDKLRNWKVYASPYWLAHALCALGRLDEAIHQLRQSVRYKEWFLMFLKHEPGFAELRALAEFDALRRRVGLP